jgi:hypothetical protein
MTENIFAVEWAILKVRAATIKAEIAVDQMASCLNFIFLVERYTLSELDSRHSFTIYFYLKR